MARRIVLFGSVVAVLAATIAGAAAAGVPNRAAAPPAETAVGSAAYDASGRPAEVISAIAGVVGRFVWDANGHLIREERRGVGPIHYAYDAQGRRVASSNGQSTTVYSYDAAGRLTAITGAPTRQAYSYDNEGRVASIGGSSAVRLSWDVVNAVPRLTRVTPIHGEATSYAYDGAGRLASRVIGASAQELTWSGGELVSLSDGKSVVASFTYGNGRPATIDVRGVGSFRYVYDAFGSVDGLLSAAGRLAVRYQYDAYGDLLSFVRGPAWNGGLQGNPFLLHAAAGAVYDPSIRGYLFPDGAVYSPAAGQDLTLVRPDLGGGFPPGPPGYLPIYAGSPFGIFGTILAVAAGVIGAAGIVVCLVAEPCGVAGIAVAVGSAVVAEGSVAAAIVDEQNTPAKCHSSAVQPQFQGGGQILFVSSANCSSNVSSLTAIVHEWINGREIAATSNGCGNCSSVSAQLQTFNNVRACYQTSGTLDANGTTDDGVFSQDVCGQP